MRIAIIGDRDPDIVAHRANPLALELAARRLDETVESDWLATDRLRDNADLGAYDGCWCVPGSPYRSMDGALAAIRYARERSLPFLGTCGGFQHAMIEYARNALGWADAEHAETAPGAPRQVIAPLACALIEVAGAVRFVPGSRIAAAYVGQDATEGYRCGYGLNPDCREALTAGPLRVTAEDNAGDVRGIELDGHPFFVATLFQPERAALRGMAPPLVVAFLRAAAREQERRGRAGASPPP